MQLLHAFYLVGVVIGALWTVVVPAVLVGGSTLHVAIRWGAVSWPPPNTTFRSWWRVVGSGRFGGPLGRAASAAR